MLGDAPLDLHDPDAFGRVYDEHAAGVLAVARRILGEARAQDVTQDVFLGLWRRPERYDPSRGDLGAFLRLMARSRAVDVWREDRAAARATDRFAVLTPLDEGRVEDRPAPAAERAGDRRAVRDALRRLPEPQREALVLAYWGGLTAEQVARQARVPLGTAKSRIRLGLGKLAASPALEDLA